MGNWQEKIREAQRKEAGDERRREAESERPKERVLDEASIAQELSSLLDKAGAKDLLLSLRNEVWRVGEVYTESKINVPSERGRRFRDTYTIGLRYFYDDIEHAKGYRTVGYTPAIGGSPIKEAWDYGWKVFTTATYTYISLQRVFEVPAGSDILAVRQNQPFSYYSVEVRGLYLGIGGYEGFPRFDWTNPRELRPALEECLLQDSVKRTQEKCLPLDLKERAREKIAKHA